MLDAWNETNPDRWLRDLTDYRNLFIHSEPLGANEHARWLSLVERSSTHGKVMHVQMFVPFRSGSSQTCDALERFVGLHAKMCRLADFAVKYAKYAPQVPHFEIPYIPRIPPT